MTELHRYPDGNGLKVKQALANKLNLNQNQITLGNGSNDILELIVRTFVMPDKEVIFSTHAFAVYSIVTQAVNGIMKIAPANSAEHIMPYGHNLTAMLTQITDKTRVIFVANPNNPTGTWLNQNELYNFIKHIPDNIIVVIDEAYFEYVKEIDYPNTLQWLDEFKNLVITRTFSKIYGIPSVRIGYGISHPELADLLNRVRQPFNVNAVAQAAAIAALSDDAHVSKSLKTNQQGMAQLIAACDYMKLNYIPSVGNFICINVVNNTTVNAKTVYEGLLHEGVIVRPLTNYQLPNYLRITIGIQQENQRFIDSLKKVLAK